MTRWNSGLSATFNDLYNCLEEDYFFWDEKILREFCPDFDAQLDHMKWLARTHNVLEGVKLEDQGGTVSVVIGNFMKSCYLPFLLNQLAHQTLPPERFEILLVDSADEPAFLPVVRFCHHRWPELQIRAFETHEDRNKTVTTRRNVGARHARHDVIIMFDSDWLPIGNHFLQALLNVQQHLGQRRAGRAMVRGTGLFALNTGESNKIFGRHLRGPEKCFHPKKSDWQLYPLPTFRVIHERNDHDFVFALSTIDYHQTKGFPEECVGGMGIEDRFFNSFLAPLKIPWGWAIDAWAVNLSSFPTLVSMERAEPWTLVPCTTVPNGENWGNPPSLEDLTPYLDE